MRNIKITITSKDGSIISLDGPSKVSDSEKDMKAIKVTALEIHMDTIDDNVRVKNDSVLPRVNIKGFFNQKSSSDGVSQMIDMFNWARDDNDDTNYRTVDIEIFDASPTQAVRKYHFPRMFVRDYKEFYGNDKDGKDIGTRFELYLNQEEYNLGSTSSTL